MKIAFIGTGIMGSRMAGHLLAHDYDVTVYNRTRSKTDGLIEQGATWADTPKNAVNSADVIITMLAHPDAVEASALNEETGFLGATKDNALWIDCSTVNPFFARKMAEQATNHGIRFLDAPVAGSKNQARDAQLVFFVGGSDNDIATAKPLFEAMGKAINHVGEQGQGNALKLVINHLLATSMIAFAEGLVLGESLGISQETLLNTIIGGVVAPPYLAGKRAKIEQGDYDAEFPLQWMQKDMQMVAETAFQTGTAMPTANSAKEIFQLASQYGYAEQDFSAIYAFLKGE